MERQVSTCKSCGAPMRWVVTQKKKRMPIDDNPHAEGRFVIDDEHSTTPNVRFLKQGEEYEGDRFTSHFETCDAPERFSKKGK